MTTTTEHGRNVLSGIIPNRIDLLEEALNELSPEYFTDSVQRTIFSFLERYYQNAGGVLPLGALRDILARASADPGRVALYEESYKDFMSHRPSDDEFRWASHEIKEDYAESEMEDALTNAVKILKQGEEQKNGDILRGQAPAREYLLERLSDIDSTISGQEAPHGEMRDEGSVILKELFLVHHQ